MTSIVVEVLAIGVEMAKKDSDTNSGVGAVTTSKVGDKVLAILIVEWVFFFFM